MVILVNDWGAGWVGQNVCSNSGGNPPEIVQIKSNLQFLLFLFLECSLSEQKMFIAHLPNLLSTTA